MLPRLLLLACLTISTLAAAPVEIVPPEWRGAVQPQVVASPGRMASAAALGDGFIVVWEKPDGDSVRLFAEGVSK